MNIILRLTIVIVFLQLCAAASLASNSNLTTNQAVSKNTISNDPKFDAQLTIVFNSFDAFMNASWVDDDRVFASIRYQIDTEIQNGASPEKVLDEWEKPYLKNSRNAQLIFGYEYAAYQVVHWSDTENVSRFQDVQTATQICYSFFNIVSIGKKHVPLPHTYNMARLVYLDDVMGFPDPDGIPLGYRLLKRDSTDKTIEYHLIQQLDLRNASGDFKSANAMAKVLVHTDPNSPRSWGLRALIAQHEALEKHDLASFDESISDERKIASLFPGGSIGNQNAEVMADQWQRQRNVYANAGWQ